MGQVTSTLQLGFLEPWVAGTAPSLSCSTLTGSADRWIPVLGLGKGRTM